MSHVHLVANEEARARLIQLGEASASIHVIGSPDLDIMMSPTLPTLKKAQARYKITFNDYLVAIFHPVTTDLAASKHAAKEFVSALIESGRNFVVIHPNNDTGHEHILQEYERLRTIPERFRIFESLRFEYFLTLLRNAQALVGNSSAGIREAPIYGVPSVDVGDRQRGRYDGPSIFPCPPTSTAITTAMNSATAAPRVPQVGSFGDGRSSEQFVQLLKTGQLFDAPVDKVFVDLKDVM
jgi:UDP-N-acetylglucosamine 2-epimerase (hydrolysing)